MMGRSGSGGEQLFYSFSLDEKIPADHLLRRIDKHLDFDELRVHLKPFYSHIGRPSVDPELMIRMLIVGYCYAIRSERRLCEEVDMNLAYRWFCRLGLEDPIPDHSTFSKNRHGRFRDSDLFRKVFEMTVARCMAEGLVQGEGFAVDGSLVRANVNRLHYVRPDEEDIDWSDPSMATRPVREYLDALDLQNIPRKAISLTDPGAKWTAADGDRPYFAWSTNYLVDVECSIIVDVEASPGWRPGEVEASKVMIDRTEERFGMKPKRLLGDKAYGTAKMLQWLVEEKQISPHVSLWEKTHRNKFNRSDFVFDPAADTFTCPAGNPLKNQWRTYKTKRSGVTKAGTRIYRARESDCSICPLKDQCCPGQRFRKVTTSVHEAAREEVRRLRHTPEYIQSRKDRKKVEMNFAHLKRLLGIDRLRLRGPTGAQDEFTLAATAQNLRKLARYATKPTRNLKSA